MLENKPQPKKANAGRLSDLPYGELRKYHNTDRTKSFKGRLVAFDSGIGRVRLRLENGRMSDPEFLKLSKEDQEYVVEATAATRAHGRGLRTRPDAARFSCGAVCRERARVCI